MLRLNELKLPLDHSAADLEAAICARLDIDPAALIRYSVARRGNDARRKSAIQLVYALDVTVADQPGVLARHPADPQVRPAPDTAYRFPVMAPPGWAGPRPVVIGAGPCGLLAALILAQMGLKPIIIERGKAVRARTKDTWALWRRSVLEPESNVQFGEGGAGTFSDGKLYSRIKDPRHLGRKVLVEFVKAGAPADILTEAHPHVGTFRLVTMVMSIRETIEGSRRRVSLRDAGGRSCHRPRCARRALHGRPGAFDGRGAASPPRDHGSGPFGARYVCRAPCAGGAYRSQALCHRRAGSNIHNDWSMSRATARVRATPFWALLPIRWRIRRAMAARSTASACARVGG